MATYNSTDVTAGTPPRLGVYPTKTFGVITVASNITLGSGAPDVLNICYIPNNSFMSNFKLWMPTLPASLGMSLQDSLTTTTTYIAAFTTANTATGTPAGYIDMGWIPAAVALTQYGSVAKSIGGVTATPQKIWVSGALLQLVVITSAGATTGATAVNLTYMVEFTPTYQGT